MHKRGRDDDPSSNKRHQSAVTTDIIDSDPSPPTGRPTSPSSLLSSTQLTDTILSALLHAQDGSDTALDGYYCDLALASLISLYARPPTCFLLGLKWSHSSNTFLPSVYSSLDTSTMLNDLEQFRISAHSDHRSVGPLSHCPFFECQPLLSYPAPSNPTDQCRIASREVIQRVTTSLTHNSWRVFACIEGHRVVPSDTDLWPALHPPYLVYRPVEGRRRREVLWFEDEERLKRWCVRRLGKGRDWGVERLVQEVVRKGGEGGGEWGEVRGEDWVRLAMFYGAQRLDVEDEKCQDMYCDQDDL